MADNDQRHRREFVPPPWEREQFEELARQRAEQDLDRLVESIGTPPSAPEAEAATDSGVDGGVAVVEPVAAKPAAEVKATSLPESELPISDAELQVMLYGLKAQEPDAVKHAATVTLVVAVLMSVSGALILGYGLLVLSRSMRAGPGAAVGAATVIGTGALFIAAGAWLAVRGLRQRGER